MYSSRGSKDCQERNSILCLENSVVQPLLTDLYQITMAYAYWKSGILNETRHGKLEVWKSGILNETRHGKLEVWKSGILNETRHGKLEVLVKSLVSLNFRNNFHPLYVDFL